MPGKAVLDSSAIASLFFDEEAASKLTAQVVSENDLFTLDIAAAEVGNVAWKRVVHFKKDMDATFQSLQGCRDFIIEACNVLRSIDLMEDAYRISVDDGIAFYDALFLAAAEREEAPLLTLDRKLFDRAKGKRDVRLVG